MQDMAFVGETESCLAEKVATVTELDDIDAMVTTHRARLLRFVTYSTGDPDLAESITQDTLLKAYNARDSFRGECTINTWLTGIAINETREHLRTKRYKFWRWVKSTAINVREITSFLPANESGPHGQLPAKERVKRLARVLETMPYNQRTIFLMKFSQEMPVTDISETLGMSINTVRTHLHRALKAVRCQIGATSRTPVLCSAVRPH
jgi:RNA polymerase sigma-70 factor (ECF subfamily)